MVKPILKLVPSALTIVFIFYGIFHFIAEIFTNFIPLGILLTFFIVFGIYGLKVPQPPQEAVESIVGKDLLSEESVDGYTVKTIAHRGAGLDAPENSLTAFDLVSHTPKQNLIIRKHQVIVSHVISLNCSAIQEDAILLNLMSL